MATFIVHDPPGSIKEDLDFDKFMDEILISEIKNNGKKDEDIEDNRVKKALSKRDRVSSKIRY